MNAINIAIDGYSGCGKSTLARDLAKVLGYRFVDTGAMYRAITLLVLEQSDEISEDAVSKALAQHPEISFESSSNHVLINGMNREIEIREMRIALKVSQVASMPSVRDYLFQLQTNLISEKHVVMEGRDIGTVIMPEAEVKFFITASIESRVNRRQKQLLDEGKVVSREEVQENLESRDFQDANRANAPLALAQDAIAMDTSHFSKEEQIKACLAIIQPKLNPTELLRFV